MADQCPNKSDIQAVFKRLRNIPANKVCFDCSAKNPTWATVTYGVFICIDCSAVHRGLGVHLTFVRSTQLDTNWTWLQLRQMQLGGNGNANSFFRQHNCTSTDAQQKYNSRAAQLYREKLHQMAIQAMRIHGNKLEINASHQPSQVKAVHLDSTHEPNPAEEKKDIDFFEEHTSYDHFEPVDPVDPFEQNNFKPIANESKLMPEFDGEPNVDLALNSDSQVTGTTRKATIGNRKPAQKKGLGAKKGGLGAQRVKANFEDIEREAQIADEMKERAVEDAKKVVEVSVKEQEEQLASMRLAYQDLSVQQKKQEEKLKLADPKKAQQMERLGMGFASRTGVSHSALSDMKTIDQEGLIETAPRSMPPSRPAFESDFFDDFQLGGYSAMYKGQSDKSMEWTMLDKERGSSGKGWSDSGSDKGWSDSATAKGWSDNGSSKGWSEPEPSRPPPREVAPVSGNSTEAQKKFGSAKAISSDQFFQDSGDNNWERKTNLARFEGSSSISSSDYFGDGRTAQHPHAGSSMQAPDLDDVKESVRQGVTKVAGKLSNLANGVMSSIQERYGY